MVHVHLPGADPHKPQIYAKDVLMRAFFSSLCMGSSQTLSCICHPNVHLMGSSAPWRSELIISPCAPILWYLSAGHGPAHQKLRPPGAHQSKTSWQCESNFIIKIIKCMHDTPNRSSNSSKTLHRPTIQSQSNQRATYWVNTHKNWKVSAKGYPKHV
jgi:hypothetical protein